MKTINKAQLEALYKMAQNIYCYGSRVYGTSTEESDFDYILVLSDDYDRTAIFDFSEDNQVECDRTQCTIYTNTEFKDRLSNCDVSALECYFLPDKFREKENIKYNIEINRELVYRNFSQVASNSWVKCKKKLEKEHDYRVGKKSLWHSLRILFFAKQILESGKITNYSVINRLYSEIVDNDINDYSHYKNTYQGMYNSIRSYVKRFYYCKDFMHESSDIKCNCDLSNPFCVECTSRRLTETVLR